MFVSCSWDDGIHDYRVVNVLRRLGITKATFFPLLWGEVGKPHARQLYAGFEVGNHTWTHRHATVVSLDELRTSIKDMERFLERALGTRPLGLAFPFGTMTEELHKFVISQGYLYTRGIHKSLSSLDYVAPDADYSADNFWSLYDNANKSFVFYGHAGQITEEGLERDLRRMLDDGCVFVTHRELVERRKLL